MRFCIHRGTQEIGDTCVEIESQGECLVLDVGLPLDDAAAMMDLHPVRGFQKLDPSLLGVLISHPHADHYGLASRLPIETHFLIGAGAQAILKAADFFTPSGLTLENTTHLHDREPIALGSFTITPYLVDHSAYDSYAILIEADGKRLFYSGDFRAHGRNAGLVEKLVADPPKDVDVLLMEGTTIGRAVTAGGYPTEDELVPMMSELFQQDDGMALVWASGQNIDRLETIYRACQDTKKQLILDVYTAHVLMATGNERVPQPSWEDIRIYLPKSQKRQIIRDRSFELVTPLKPYRIYPEDISKDANRSVMLFRPSMRNDLDNMDGLNLSRLIVSVWGGYLKDEKNKPLMEWIQRKSLPIDHCHTSGHASVAWLKKMRQAFASATLTPVHTEHPQTLAATMQPARVAQDGQWIEV